MKDNKMIAEFMQLPTEIFQPRGIINYGIDDSWYEEHELSYHLSWDWLMPVIRKINEVSKYDDYCKDRLHLQRMLDECINENTIGRLEVYKAVVEFINQYNKNQ